MRMVFAQIDAKEQDVIDTYDGKGFNQHASLKENKRIFKIATEEYLRELRILQTKIQQKFQPQLIDERVIINLKESEAEEYPLYYS